MVNKYIPKVGDKVIITEGFENFNDSMRKFVGKTAILLKHRSYKANDRNYFSIDLDSVFCWQYDKGHFKPIPNQTYELW